jgi:hypothetical protein
MSVTSLVARRGVDGSVRVQVGHDGAEILDEDVISVGEIARSIAGESERAGEPLRVLMIRHSRAQFEEASARGACLRHGVLCARCATAWRRREALAEEMCQDGRRLLDRYDATRNDACDLAERVKVARGHRG